MNNKFMIVTVIYEENGLYTFSLKLRDENGKFQPVQYWQYRSIVQAQAAREQVLNARFPAPTLRMVV